MSAAWIIYFAGISFSISTFLFVAVILCLVIAFAIFMYISCERLTPDELTGFKKKIMRLVYSASALGLIWSAIPNQNTIYLMAGAKVTEDIVKSPEAKEIGGKIMKVINQKLDEQIKK